jgi:hypothetical protein
MITASVNGGETSRDTMTNVGVVLPTHVRAEDTRDGMKDRISLGGPGTGGGTGTDLSGGVSSGGNWGAYTGTVIVAPNMQGTGGINLAILRPSNDDKYGNAIVDSNDIARLTRVTQGIVNIYGTVQTAVSLGPDGQDDGQARNAGNLQLGAGVGAIVGAAMGFSVAVIPEAVKFYDPATLDGDQAPRRNMWLWGVEWTVEAVPDVGSLALLSHVQIRERITVLRSTGFFGSSQGVFDTIALPANKPFFDDNGITAISTSPEQARIEAREGIISAGTPAMVSSTQVFRYKNSIIDKRDADWHNVIKSGFFIQQDLITTLQVLVQLTVSRQPAPVGDVKAGILAAPYIGTEVII